VPALLRFARGRGVSVRDVAGRFDLAPDAAEAHEVTIAPSTISSLFEVVADECGEPWVGLRLAAEAPRAGAYESFMRALGSSSTVRDALDALAPHTSRIHPRLRASSVREGDGSRWSQVHVGLSRGAGRHAEEYGLAFVLARCREACVETPLHVESVSFSHARPREVLPLQRFFGTDVLTFGVERTTFTLARVTLDAPLHARVERRADAPGETVRPVSPIDQTAARVAAALPELLARGATLEGVARSLGLSERTLQRRLEGEGTSFLEIQDHVRERCARELLRDATLSLVDIAERLGFSDLATFSRAFKRWTGQPPGMFRRRSIA
jgi:AraC-like DNA-binding protein